MDNIKTKIDFREDLTSLIDELGLKIGAELGVCNGAFSNYILENSNLEKLYSIDSWKDDIETTKAVFKKRASTKIEKFFDEAKNLLGKHGTRSQIIKNTSFEACKNFEDNSLDFIYIDASHRFSGVALDLINWFPKVRYGGIFAGHDYWNCYRCEVMEAVNGFFVEQKQILHITSKGINSRGNSFYPPTWWCIKQNLRKSEYNKELSRSIDELSIRKKELENSGINITLPYQYSIR